MKVNKYKLKVTVIENLFLITYLSGRMLSGLLLSLKDDHNEHNNIITHTSNGDNKIRNEEQRENKNI